MLEAKKKRWFEEVFAVYNRNLFRRRFHSFHVSDLNFLSADRKTPQIIYADHSNWWDGLVAFEISRRAKLDSFVMMEERQLKKLFLFRRLGAFSVVRENAREAVKSVNYAANLLKENPSRTLWIFPQGEILPNDRRPLRFFNGAARIVEKTVAVKAVPLAMRYEFRGEFKPEIFVKIGEPELISQINKNETKNLTERFEKRLTAVLDELKRDVSSGDLQNYRNILS
jgi:chlorobactene lauroyltransferase